MDELKAWMAEQGVTQAQLGKKVGCNQSAISQWFQKGRIGYESVVKVAEVTGIPEWELRPDLYRKPS